jgi:hypothetical protein
MSGTVQALLANAPPPTIPMFAPDGTLGDVPYEHTHDALAAGGKMAYKMLSPDGTIGYVPADRMQDAQKAGGRIVPYEASDADGSKPGFWSQYTQQFKDMASSMGQSLHKFNEDSKTPGVNPYGSPVSDLAEEVKARSAEGRSPVYNAASTAVEAVGIPTRPMETAANAGNTKGVLAAAAAPATLAIAPSLARPAMGALADATAGVRQSAAESIVSPVLKRTPTMIVEDNRFGRNPQAAIVNEGLTGSRESMVDQATQKIGEISRDTEQKLSTGPNANASIDAAPIIDGSIDTAIKSAKKLGQTSVISRLEDLRTALKNEYGATNGTPLEMNKLKQDIGESAASLRAFRSTDPLEGSAAGAMEYIYSRLKQAVNEKVPEVANNNTKVSNLISARTAMQRAINLDEDKGIFSGMTVSNAPFKIAEKTAASPTTRTSVAQMIAPSQTTSLPSRLQANSPISLTPPGTSGPQRPPLAATGTNGPTPSASGPQRPLYGGRYTPEQVAAATKYGVQATSLDKINAEIAAETDPANKARLQRMKQTMLEENQ